MDLQKIIVDSLAKIESEGKIKAIIEKHLSDALNSVISDIFSYSSEIRKALKEEIQKKARINIEELTIPEYGKMATTLVQQVLDSHLHVNGMQEIKKQVDQMLNQEVPESIKVSELMEQFAREPGIAEDPLEEISFYGENHEGGYFWMHFDKERRTPKHLCEYTVACNKEGRIFSCELRGKKIDEKVFLGGLYAFDAKLFKMYAAGTKIIPDFDCVETEFSHEEY